MTPFSPEARLRAATRQVEHARHLAVGQPSGGPMARLAAATAREAVKNAEALRAELRGLLAQADAIVAEADRIVAEHEGKETA